MDAAPRLKRRRSQAPASDGTETIEVQTRDGRSLRATVREPRPDATFRGVAVLAHAMFARRSEWERASFAAFLQDRGWRTIAFDFRGHGDSGPSAAQGGTWRYDDLVTLDLPAVVDGARARSEGERVVVIGHSLGGHVALAAQATGTLDADALGLVAANVWLRACEPSAVRWIAKQGVVRTLDAIVGRFGRFPARALRQGSDDECAGYMRDLVDVAARGWWGSSDGRIDYWDAIHRVKVPVYSLASDRDPINCAPECAARFVLHTRGPVTIERLRASDDGGPPPGHMELVTRDSARSSWAKLERWLRTQ